ncbi:MFS transporter [Asticcacaulis sp.]|uniref:MFS transporter n=1 Tax=Asticcacaulis sp. TaxID=1872648 RepID=UPI002BBE9D9F|nr:MFS transporter [Asticcacaulis sp.]HTM83135.1 MFS transporter [Asticcacaulis sp.]
MLGTMTQDAKAAAPPGWLEKISYGSGDFGFNLYWTTISAFLLIFYTDSFGLSAAAAGTMLLTTKLVDAFADPIMGAVADRTRTKWGRFRPWLLWAAVPLAASGVLTFTTPDLDSTAKLIYAYATFALMMVIYSIINIPYGALSGVLTNDPQARTQLNSFRFVGGFLGGTFVTFMTPKLVKALGGANEVLGWQLTMTLYGVIACGLFATLFLTARERVEPIAEKAVSPWKDIGDLLQNRPWLIMFVLALVVMVTISTRMGASAYYIKYYVGKPEQTAAFLTVYGMALAVGSLITPLLTRFIDKRRLLIILMVLVGILSSAFFFIPKDQIGLMYGLQIAIGLCLGPKSPLTFSMYADCADYNEYKTGRRATAMTFAAATFSQKLGGALASFVIGSVLASLGYVANQAQSGASQTGIVLLISIVPGALALIAAVIMYFYNLTDARLADIQTVLAERKAQS